MTVQERFAADWGMPLERVWLLVQIARQAGEANEAECNGDPHPEAKDKRDKNECAKLWGRTGDSYTAQIVEVVKPYGFTAVVYTGLGPTLKRGDQFVEVPY